MASGLRWSPQGDRIRFTLHSGVALKDSAIWEVSSVSGKAGPLFPGLTSRQADGEWTSDGKYYLFSRAEKGVSQIWALLESRTWFGKSTQRPAIQLTTGPMETLLPTPSPSSNRIFFYGIVQRSQLFKRDAQSGRFERFLPGISGAHVDFSQDGQWITYSSHPEHALWRAGADGSNRLRLSPPNWQAMLPVISPDGHEIAFVGGALGDPGSIFVVDRDGGPLRKIVSTEPKGIIEPAWSPDSKSLVLGTSAAEKEHTVLYHFDFKSGSLTAMPGSEGLWSPRWSPDGRFVAALHNPDCKLVLYELKSHWQTPLTDFGVAYPAWSHRGQYLYFRAGETHEAWFRIGIAGRVIERVADLSEVGTLPAKPSRGIRSWVNSWAGLAPDDSLLTASEAGRSRSTRQSW